MKMNTVFVILALFAVSCTAYTYKYYDWIYDQLLIDTLDSQTQKNFIDNCDSVETIDQADNETAIAAFTRWKFRCRYDVF